MNWGHKITIVFVGFTVLIGTMVYKCMQQKIDLVSEDYYTQELKFQDKIDGSKAAAKISPVKISQTASKVIIQMPQELKGLSLKGDVWLYCANEPADDVKLPLHVDVNGVMDISKNHIAGTSYTAKITWNNGDTNYYKEIPFTIAK